MGPSMLHRIARRLRHLGREYLSAIVSLLPNDVISCHLRRLAFNALGARIAPSARIYRNVLILGLVEVGERSSVSNNVTLSGAEAGIRIGKDVMIAPGCCIVAFNHGTALGAGPMISQDLIEAPICIEDDVWVGANSTVTAGTTLGNGAVVAANSAVVKDVPANAIFGGVPARLLRMRQ